MNTAEEEAFLARLAQAAAESQTDMALETVIAHLPAAARSLLERLPAYHTAVPPEGILVLAPDLPDPAALLTRLTAVSLVERYPEPAWQSLEYQLHPLVTAWLDQHATHPAAPWFEAAARYQRYLFEQERRSLSQRIIVHTALRRAGQNDEADRFALDYIVGPLNQAGFFSTLLADWLPPICQSSDDYTRAEALGQTGKQLFHLGSYDTALKYLQQSLAISQEIGDVAGLCATLFNMGHIHWQNEDQAQALQAWVTVYKLARQLNLAQALQALEKLAGQIGLPGGLQGWDALAQKMEEGS
jgi:tetratricopeptide (TPR) repeat protein